MGLWRSVVVIIWLKGLNDLHRIFIANHKHVKIANAVIESNKRCLFAALSVWDGMILCMILQCDWNFLRGISYFVQADNLVENLLEDFEFEVQVPYLLYRNAAQEVNGIWFYNAHECEEVANLFTRYWLISLWYFSLIVVFSLASMFHISLQLRI